jgi:TolB-like protein/DNA-binding winged helix-turn-helix (wHTH) protein/Tfp pilus assembly protein PilF
MTLAPFYRVDDLLIDTQARRVTRDGIELPLTSLSFELLLALTRAAPNLASFDALIARAWSGVVVSPEAVTQRVKQLRQALGDNAEHPRYVLAVRGHGYRMPTAAIPLAAVPSPLGVTAVAADLPAVAGSSDLPGRALRGAAVRRWLLVIAVTAGLGAVVYWSIEHVGSPRLQSPVQPQQQSQLLHRIPTISVGAPAPAGSIAVLPFANLTGDPAKDYFGDGMAEEMINALGQIPGLKVTARTSSFAYRGQNVDVRRVAQDLGVSAVLEGSVRSAGARIRITAQLVDAHSGYQLWSQSYDREFGDIFKLQDDLSGAIVKALKVNLSGPAPSSIAEAPPTRNIEAYDLYLQGEALINSPDHGFERAIERFQQALALDPDFARAYAGIGLVRFFYAQGGLRPLENLAEAERDAQKALSLAPNLAQAHEDLANIDALRGHWREAEAQSRAELALDPGSTLAHMTHGAVLTGVGHLREALAEFNTVLALAPVFPPAIQFKTAVYSAMGRDVDAVREAKFEADLGIPAPVLPFASEEMALHAGRYAQAAAMAEARLQQAKSGQAPDAQVSRLVYAALADPGKKAVAMAAIPRLFPGARTADSQRGITDVTSCLVNSYTYALLGNLDVAFGLANRCVNSMVPGAVDVGSTFTLWLPVTRPFRQDPRFQALATRLGYMGYWQQYGPPDECDLNAGQLTCH